MGFFTKLLNILRVMWKSVFGRVALQTVSSIITTLGKDAVDILVQRGKAKALELESQYPSGSGQAKHDELVDFLKNTGINIGLNLSASLVNLLIEVIVNAMNNPDFWDKTEAPTSVGTPPTV